MSKETETTDTPQPKADVPLAAPGGDGVITAKPAEEVQPPTGKSQVDEKLPKLQTAEQKDEYLSEEHLRSRRVRLPVILFVITCLSCFFAGATRFMPSLYIAHLTAGDFMAIRRVLVTGWLDGLIYTACVLGILFAHEMGHFLMTLRHRIPASFPYFLPVPITPIGTMGAVIGMDGLKADRRQMFDIGIAGPLAGLVVAIPVMWIGVAQLDLTQTKSGQIVFDCPVMVRWMLDYIQPAGYTPGARVWISQLNPYFMAGWVGLLITGLNMMPVSQLDGGHVIYTLFGKRAHIIARGFLFFAMAYVVLANAYIWVLMLMLVTLIGTDHPETRDDSGRSAAGDRLRLAGDPVLMLPTAGIDLGGSVERSYPSRREAKGVAPRLLAMSFPGGLAVPHECFP